MESSYYAGQRFKLLRDHDVSDTSVSNIELFFDLVYVFAVTQLSHVLLGHLTWRGALEAAILTLAVWWAWIDTSWITNWFDPTLMSVRFMLIGLMLLGLIMSAAIPEAFDGRGLMFALAYVSVQVGRTLFCVIALGSNQQSMNFRRILFWAVMSAPLWIAGGVAEGDTRLWLWIAAVALDCAAPAMGFRTPGIGKSTTDDWKISGEHLAERCQLFIIICLGESILLTGATLSDHEIHTANFIAFAIAFALSVSMFWIYFSRAGRAAELISHSDDEGAYGRAYTYFHLPMVAGIIALAVANELVIAHPEGHTAPKLTAVAVAGASLYLIGSALFNMTLTRAFPSRRGIALALALLLIPLAHWISPIALLGAVLLIFIGLAVADFVETPPRHGESGEEEVQIPAG
jgi:low temperature requirement protein LtrA